MRRLLAGGGLGFRASEAVLLVVTATVVAFGLLVIGLVSRHLGISKSWILFGGGAAVYTLVTFYLLNQIKPLRQRFHVGKMLTATLVIEAPVLALWLSFYRDLLSLPDSMFPYTIGGIVVAPAMVILIELWVFAEQKETA